MSIRETYNSLKEKLINLFGEDNQIPEEGTDDVKTAEYVQALFDEGLKYEEDHFANTAHMRPVMNYKNNAKYSMTPNEWRRACDELAAGNLYEVIGRRNETPKTKWRSENVEGLIPSNMAVRGSYISSNWHDITVTPNIQHADDIFDQERKHEAVGWTEFVDDFREIAQKYGVADCRVEFNNDEEGGHVCVTVIRPGDFAFTPFAKWIDKKSGGTYCVHGRMVNNRYIEQYYPDLVGEAQPSGVLSSMQKFTVRDTTQRGEYEHTKTYLHLELFMDDDTLEERPFTDPEVEQLAVELEDMTLGVQVEAKKEQNHKVHIKQATEAVKNFLSTIGNETQRPEEDVAFANNVLNAFSQNIAEHTDMMDPEDPYSMGKQKKYPYGRYVCVIGGKLATDEPNPNVRKDGYGVPWRRLFYRTYSKKMFGRNDGVGDPETLFQDEKKASIALSRFEDSVVLATPKRYRNISDLLNKATKAEQEDNDPTAVGYYTQTPPVSIEGKVSEASLKMREIAVQKAERAQGVNNISIGGEPKGQSSGFQTQLLQKQNERIVTGDLDRNLRFTLQEVIEGMFEMYKVWYIEPRQYIINGQYAPINVSEALSFMEITDQQGGKQRVAIPKLQITIRPFSNYPNRFEIELGALVEIYKLQDEMGLPMIPSAAIKKFLANKYPEAAENGEWPRLNKATEIGLQVMQQQQQAQEAQQQAQEQDRKTIDSVTRGFERQNLKQQFIGENGNGGLGGH